MGRATKATGWIMPTRFKQLGYVCDAPGLWRVVDKDGEHRVGPQYRTKAELLADLNRYATEYGAELA
jgi:hypothetical protein